MIRTSQFILPALPWLAATALVCSVVVIGPHGALAQKAGNLNCNKCVDTGEIARKSITKSRIKKGAVKKSRLTTDLQEHVDGREAFFITLDGNGSTATIATHGPLSFVARCLLDQDNGVGGFEDRIEIVATSSQAGWFEEDESASATGGNVPLSAGQEVIALFQEVDPVNNALYRDLQEASMVAPDGSYLALDGDSGGLGLNIFGHDCVAAGNIYRITGAL